MVVEKDSLKTIVESNFLESSINILKGRICIITFHSLEDRIVKNIYRE